MVDTWGEIALWIDNSKKVNLTQHIDPYNESPPFLSTLLWVSIWGQK